MLSTIPFNTLADALESEGFFPVSKQEAVNKCWELGWTEEMVRAKAAGKAKPEPTIRSVLEKAAEPTKEQDPTPEPTIEKSSLNGAYSMPERVRKVFALATATGMNLWLYGPKGAGKTEAARHWAESQERPFVRVQFDASTERADIIGGWGLENGKTVFKHGVIAMAIQQEGAVILLDEITYARPENLASLQGLLEGKELRIAETGEVIPIAEGVQFVAADNTNGAGDNTGRYSGTRPLNAAFVDRFGLMLEMPGHSKEKIAEIVRGRTGCSAVHAAVIGHFAHLAQQKVASGILSDAPSIRGLCAWGHALNAGMENAAEITILAKYPEEERGEAEVLVKIAGGKA